MRSTTLYGAGARLQKCLLAYVELHHTAEAAPRCFLCECLGWHTLGLAANTSMGLRNLSRRAICPNCDILTARAAATAKLQTSQQMAPCHSWAQSACTACQQAPLRSRLPIGINEPTSDGPLSCSPRRAREARPGRVKLRLAPRASSAIAGRCAALQAVSSILLSCHLRLP